MFKEEKSAYMTVEASLIVPMILGGIVFVLYMGFYLYNFATMKQTAYIAALRGSQMKKVSSEEIETYVEKQVDEMLFGQLLAKQNIKKDVKVSMGNINVKIYTDVKIPFAGDLSFKETGWKIEAESRVNKINPIEIIRGVRKINGRQISK